MLSPVKLITEFDDLMGSILAGLNVEIIPWLMPPALLIDRNGKPGCIVWHSGCNITLFNYTTRQSHNINLVAPDSIERIRQLVEGSLNDHVKF